MEHRHLGRSGLKVSEIVHGNVLYPYDSTPNETVLGCLRAALDCGITTFDTADIYGMGRSEELLGRAVAGEPRESLVLCTKVFFPASPGPNGSGLSRKHLREGVDASLRRLGTDYLDLYTAHRFDSDTPLEETMLGFADLVRAGKVLYVGVSEWTAAQIGEAAKLAAELRVPLIASSPQYSALWRVPEAEVIPACERVGIGQIPYWTVAQGVLTGKYLPGETPPEGSRGGSEMVGGRARFMKRLLRDEVLGAVRQLAPLAQEAGLTMSQLAIAWVLRHPNVAGAAVGASRTEQVRENAGAAGVRLDPAVVERMDKILALAAVTDPADG